MNRRTSATLEREPAALDIQVVVGEFEGNIATSQLLVDRGEGVDLEREIENALVDTITGIHLFIAVYSTATSAAAENTAAKISYDWLD